MVEEVYSGPIRPLNWVKHGMVVEPREGHTDDEVMAILKEFDIEAEILVPGYVSSSVTSADLDALGIERKEDLERRLGAIARISPKHKSEPLFAEDEPFIHDDPGA